MSPLVPLFYCMTLLYFSYSSISYKVVLVDMGNLFMCSSLIYHLEASILDEEGLSIQLMSYLYLFLVFVHKLEARVHHEHDPLILLNRHRKARIRLCAWPSLV
jgi:hypothetical protein